MGIRDSLVAIIVMGSVLGMTATALPATTVVLTRHAEKADSNSPDPPLSPEGTRRSELLAWMLTSVDIARIYVTEFRRTKETAQPIAAAKKMRVTEIAADQPNPLVRAIRALRSGTVLVVGHSNTLPDLITMLGGPQVRIDEGDFDNLFILFISGAEVAFLRLQYGTNPPNVRSLRTTPEGSSLMQMRFRRSGGFAATPGLAIEGTVDFTNAGPKVSSQVAGYERTLDSSEVARLRALADPAQLADATKTLRARGNQSYDTYQYDITLEKGDGTTTTLTVNAPGGGNELKAVSPQLNGLIEWIDNEAQRIRAQRMRGR